MTARKKSSAVSDIEEPQKTLTVLFTNGIPTFAFDGHWTGRDITLIERLIRRKYVRYNRDIRRGGIR